MGSRLPPGVVVVTDEVTVASVTKSVTTKTVTYRRYRSSEFAHTAISAIAPYRYWQSIAIDLQRYRCDRLPQRETKRHAALACYVGQKLLAWRDPHSALPVIGDKERHGGNWCSVTWREPRLVFRHEPKQELDWYVANAVVTCNRALDVRCEATGCGHGATPSSSCAYSHTIVFLVIRIGEPSFL